MVTRVRKAGQSAPLKLNKKERYNVSVLKASGMVEGGIALSVGLDVEALRLSCVHELTAGAASRLAEVKIAVHGRALDGVVGAANLFIEWNEKAAIAEAEALFAGDREIVAPALGKKDQAALDAKEAHHDEGWSGLLDAGAARSH